MNPVPPTLRSFALAGIAALTLTACGGDTPRQDADEPSGTWTVDVDAEFPESQRISQPETMRISVRNREDRVLPNVAVTVDSFSTRTEQANVAAAERPVWIVDNGPRGGTTAYTNTWTLGRMEPGQTKTFEWRVTPVESGSYDVQYTVAAGLDGKAKARLAGGEVPRGTFDVTVSRAPSQSRVDPDSGEIIRD